MKLALVHDWLHALGGAERVLCELHALFPDAPIYTLFADPTFLRKHLARADVRVSGLGRIPGIRRFYKYFFPLMPAAVESMDLSDYDVVISSSAFFSKGLVLKPKTRHLCYCYSPTRSLWDRTAEYEHNDWPSRVSRHLLRVWDRHAAQRVDTFVAISEQVRERIEKYYQRPARVIYPPVTLSAEPQGALPAGVPERFYLIVSRLYRYKNIHVAVDAFNKLGYPLVIAGTGPARQMLEDMAHRNIVLLGEQGDDVVRSLYARCTAFIMPQEEDFGLTAVEAMSFGKPVLALRKGGALETVVQGATGEFFDDAIPEALADGVRRLTDAIGSYEPEAIRAHAQRFSRERFRTAMLDLIRS